MRENEMGTVVVEEAFSLHREIGPGLLETVYEVVLADALSKRGLKISRQRPVPIKYRGLKFDEGFRIDIWVEEKVILETKSVEKVPPVHLKQLQTYLRLTGCKLGYVLNFGAALMKDGIFRCVNGLEEEPPSL
jgi:GxxExxY protein